MLRVLRSGLYRFANVLNYIRRVVLKMRLHTVRPPIIESAARLAVGRSDGQMEEGCE